MLQQPAIGRSTAAFNRDETLTAVVEISRSSALEAGFLPGVDRRPLKKLEPNERDLRALVERWRPEAAAAGQTIARVALAHEAGRDGFSLARWLRSRGIEAHVIHASSVAVSRDHVRAKTDRLDTALLMRVLLGWQARWDGCAVNGDTAPWRRCRASKRKMPRGRRGSAKISSASAHAW